MGVVTSDVDLSAARFAQGIPFETFAELRRSAPVYWYEPDRYWVVTSYELVRSINRDATVFSNTQGTTGAALRQEEGDEPLGVRTILTMDPPQHTVYRKMAARSFSRSAVRSWEPLIRRTAKELLSGFAERGGGDWGTEVAAPFPFRVMAELMGIPREHEEEVLKRVETQVIGDPVKGWSAEKAQQAVAEADEYAGWLLEEHRKHPRGGDLIDHLMEARIDGKPLTEAELRAWVNLYIGAGGETTKYLIAHGLLCLLENPEARRAVQEGCNLDPVVEEMLRYTTPVMHHSRWAMETVEVNGQVIEAGQRVTLWMISANRDESVFADPDRFDITRAPNHHDTFGPTGPHYCLGAGLARLEGKVFFEEARPYLDRMEIAGDIVRGTSNIFNVLVASPVAVR
ncbi:Cytochrome P450 [Pseudonocardia thermophila]|uniref:Cytochrome P450 n=1 Tax=Pseudonocardia thermophila TaxID=1848 RepID=A0A1M7AUJ9_PSETH|nr:cytochrome P450 [Pseudonocardia thermophila]SHL46306.1 Cytochrome P450 [Pseudonocardia thermophila]